MNLRFRVVWVLLGSIAFTAYTHASPNQSKPNHAKKASRIEVEFPPLLKRHTLAAMRMHLKGLAEIQCALANRKFEKAAEVATMTLGMSSMHGNQMAKESRYMPHGMKKLGTLMHQREAQFVITAQDAAATGNVQPSLRVLAQITTTCVTCHAVYKLK